ncbi:DUF6268 family outer membrane beta-barrel protein [Lutibacter sp.]|uniref:DUF6268 family outer membrane beta-barrel protein n=1 Tax=Lutibacter sp. TaxID=1925666 RepID=UPI001A35C3DF|nr:DUF6268 family outer membrane beta-barrel protein [Lutibacter sp.]MBI9040364.1 hypothetical protein [Lutibacter sp.]
MRFKIVLLSVFIGFNSIIAQDNNVSAGVDFSFVPEHSNSVGFQNKVVSINFPVKIKSGLLLNSLQFSNYQMNYDSDLKMNTSFIDEDTFKTISYSMSYINSINNNWSYLVEVKPVLSSNFATDITSNDFLLNGGIILTKKYESSSFQLGAIKNSSYGFNSIIPVIAFNGNLSDKVSYTLGIPITELTYKVNQTNTFKTYIKPNGFYANIGNEAFEDTTSIAEKARFQSIVSGINFSHSIDDNWKIGLDVGYQISSTYELLDKNKNSVYEFQTKNNVNVGVSLKFNLLNNKN